MEWQCADGHKWKTRFDVIQNGAWCTQCTGISIEECHEWAEKNGGKCLGQRHDQPSKVTFECSNGHKWKDSFRRDRGTWCQVCSMFSRLSLKDCHSLAKDKIGGVCLSESYEAEKRLKWRCKNKHVFFNKYSAVKKWGCTACNRDEEKLAMMKRCVDAAVNRGGKCLSSFFTYAQEKMTWQCSLNHAWEASANSILSGGWCGKCRRSKSERETRQVFEDYFGKKFPSTWPDWLVNPETNRKLELDGYNEELSMAFEYDGEQHYKSIPFWGGQLALDAIKKRDKTKDRLCRENNVKLIRVPYWHKLNLYTYISQRLDQECSSNEHKETKNS